MNTFKLSIISCFIGLAIVATSVEARPPRDGKPPQEAIDACQDKSEGDQVTFETRRGDTLTGTCQLMEEQLIAVPEDHQRREKD